MMSSAPKLLLFSCCFFLMVGFSIADLGGLPPVAGSASSVSSQLPPGARTWDLTSFDGRQGSISVESGGVVLGYFRPVVRLSNGRFFGWSWVFEGGLPAGRVGGVEESLGVAWVAWPDPVVLRYGGAPGNHGSP